MQNYRGLIMFLVALIASIGAVIIASKWLNQRSVNIVQVAVASQDITMGQKLSSNMFKLIDWPSNNPLPNSFSNLAKLEGRVTKNSLQIGEPVLSTKLAPEGSLGGLSAVISEGKRAITVRVNDVVGVAGFTLPGNFVDIIVNAQKDSVDRSNVGDSISKIVLEHILVLAVAQESGRDETAPKVVNAVTLEVTPDQAEMIDLARSVGALSLVLRNQSDPKSGVTLGSTRDKLFNIKTPDSAATLPIAVNRPNDNLKPKVIVKKSANDNQRQCTKVVSGITSSLECF